jgi:hypothetical protein
MKLAHHLGRVHKLGVAQPSRQVKHLPVVDEDSREHHRPRVSDVRACDAG